MLGNTHIVNNPPVVCNVRFCNFEANEDLCTSTNMFEQNISKLSIFIFNHIHLIPMRTFSLSAWGA